MKFVRIRIANVTIEKVILANNFFLRLRGLLGRTFDGSFNGLLLKPCGDIHTIGMKYPIDVIFIDRENKVVGIRNSVKRNAPYIHGKGAKMTLELPAGFLVKNYVEVGSLCEIAACD